MRLVLDSNSLFAALIRNSAARKIILSPYLEFIAPDYIFTEVFNHKRELIKKSRLSEIEFDILFDSLFEKIIIVPSEEIKPFYKHASKLMEHIDPDDAVFLALLLCSPNDGIWTEDSHFEYIPKIKIWKTRDLIEKLGLEK